MVCGDGLPSSSSIDKGDRERLDSQIYGVYHLIYHSCKQTKYAYQCNYNNAKLPILQGKNPLAEVVKEVFSVIKFAKIVKKTFSTTFVFGNGGFGGASNGISTQLKKTGAGGCYGCFSHQCAH